MSEIERLREEVARLRRQVDRLTACPGCGRHPQGSHFCPGPYREPLAYRSEPEPYRYQGLGGLEFLE